jgi:hypothetical protein
MPNLHPSSFVGPILVFVGLCLIGSTVVASTDWLICVRNGGGQGCRQTKSDAMGAFLGAANVGLGLAVQRRDLTP